MVRFPREGTRVFQNAVLGQSYGLVARRLEVLVQHAADAFFDHINRTRHWERRHGKTDSQVRTTPEICGR